MPGWLSFLGGIVKPVVDLIDELHTSEEEKGKLRIMILGIQAEMGAKLLEYETKNLQMRADVIKAEATSESWLTRMWRPITMLVFVALVVMYWLGYTPPNITQETLGDVFDLIKLGLGGYVIGRSAEKVVPAVAQMFRGKVSGERE